MGLKSFHLLFIALACIMSLSTAVLFLRERELSPGPESTIGAVVCLVAGAALLLYGVWMARKLRRLSRKDSE